MLDDNSRAALEQYCATVERATGAQMALVTVPTLDGAPIEDFANTLFHQWGIGRKGQDNGLLLLFDVGEHKDRIEVGYGLEAILPDGFVGGTLREIRPLLRAGQFGPAMLEAAQHMGTVIAQSEGVSLDAAPLPRPHPAPSEGGSSIPWPLIIIGIVIFIWLVRRGGGGGYGPRWGGGGFLPGLILGNMMGRSRWGGGGFGGGGFGGYDGGGGGFGGFGGGDSGGGGASSDW